MSCKDENRTIGGKEVYCRQWSAQKALLMKLKTAKIFGPSFAKLAGAFTSDNAEKEISSALITLFENQEPEAVLNFMQSVVASVTIDGERITDKNYDELFREDLSLFYKVFAFVMEVNYSDFFGGKLAQTIKAKMSQLETISKDGLKDTART